MSIRNSTGVGYGAHDCEIQTQSTELVNSQFQSFNPIDQCTDTSYILNSCNS